MTACEPSVEDKIDIGLPPSADFSIEFVDDNTVKLTNTTTDNNFLTNWDLGGGTITAEESNSVEVFYSDMGEYLITLTVFGKGGSGNVTKSVNITQDAQGACNGPLEFITGCGTKTWKLNPEEGALWVGPDQTNMWWQNSAQDVIDRPCDWNDEYVFSVSGTYDYISNGDFWGEPYSGVDPESCQPISALSADRATWADGTHDFEIIAGAVPKLKVIGDGAFIALRKAANGMEVTHPISEVTYDIVDMRTESGKDILVLEIDYAVGIWRFTLASQ